MLVASDIQDLQNPAGDCLTHMFLGSQRFTGIDYFTMLCIKYLHHMIKDCNLVPNQEARLLDIQQRKLQALVWWAKDLQRHGLTISVASWTTA